MENDIVESNLNGTKTRGRPRTAWRDNIKTWTGLSVEEAVKAVEDHDIWRKMVCDAATLMSRKAEEDEKHQAEMLRWSR